MTEARLSHVWDHTSSMLAMLANCHRDPKKQRAFSAERFHPYRTKRSGSGGLAITRKNIGLLKKAFVDRRTTP